MDNCHDNIHSVIYGPQVTTSNEEIFPRDPKADA